MSHIFTKNEIVMAFVQLGVQTKPSWSKMTFESCITQEDESLYFLVSYSNNQFRTVKENQIRKYKPIQNSEEAINNLITQSFLTLLELIQQAAKELLPAKWNDITVDEHSKIIYLTGNNLSIQAGIVEVVRKSILGETVEEIASWEITSFREIPSTYINPSDVAEKSEGNSTDTVNAAALAIQKIYEYNSNDFWEGIKENLTAK